MSVLVARLSEAMAIRGIDQSMLARRLGASQGTISKIMRGKTVNSRLLPRIAIELAVPLTWLTGNDDSRPDGPLLSVQDRELVELMQQLPTQFRAAILHLSRCAADMFEKDP